MTGDFPLTFGGADLVLLPERAAYRPNPNAGSGGTLYVADTHWGKTAAFRAGGIAVPAGTTAADLSRLTAALRRVGATRLVVLGDLLHARQGRNEPAFNEAIRTWRAGVADVRIELVEGNHDRSAGGPDPRWAIDVYDEPTPDPPLVLRHVPHADPRGAVLAGHVHPAIRLDGPGGERLKLPCFHIAGDVLTLPAFTTFADGLSIRPTVGDRLCVIADGAVIEVDTSL
ncbi:ligase-associated DNA damage response endonuclease PdeM [Alienimonas chondri]|uniref:Ligase-associated DNA damage response endonuclease PdeM n=1 Tax=Alienimonas chondri TaxID=2681879 RepID=A0ABX1V8S7_9PLAN|nr:ligase-associated DNA damage response endonuclease PdeM [Alienimonas chondri]NNJ24307.1 hypothetical protein [Alienimonas chondri]